jgi:hypothetical protein
MLTENEEGPFDGKKEGEQSAVETVTTKDALQFPLYAGAMLVGLYAVIKIFGKDAVNYFILVYIAIGGGTGMKAMLQSLTGEALDKLDEAKIIDFKFKGIEI